METYTDGSEKANYNVFKKKILYKTTWSSKKIVNIVSYQLHQKKSFKT